MAELDRFLDGHRGRDFIESVRICRADWVVSGLQEERFRFRFPFRFREQRRFFDLATRLQRHLPEGWLRALPGGIDPCLGSQWWCLSRETLEAILADPGLPRMARYFRRVWIPDEAFFQTMARRHGRDLASRTLTFAPFDRTGRPVTFYDDHMAELAAIGPDHFFVRKVWEGAERLYAECMGKVPVPSASRQGAARRIAARAAQPPPVTGSPAPRRRPRKAPRDRPPPPNPAPNSRGWHRSRSRRYCPPRSRRPAGRSACSRHRSPAPWA